ncbi:hypothetical protein [Treponema sp.]|uniref:hypothetical protein n=1 Tax=Treponema sp. TaxID=166 RepID=UPI00257B4A7C|nr:hypothetical protein [Treponema sp.]MBE6354795.1 hypothetical protein [Treponema sp.]
MAKDIIEAMENFTKKMDSFKHAENKSFAVNESSEKKLQEKINRSEQERVSAIKKEYENFKNPLSREIETDENALLKAFEIFMSLTELKKNSDGEGASLRSFEIDCSICRKSEYTRPACSKFIFLQSWFYFEKKVTEYIPVICRSDKGHYFIDFLSADENRFYSREKEIWQTVASLY